MSRLISFLYGILILLFNGCCGKIYSDDQMKISPQFLQLFNAASKQKNIYFKNYSGKEVSFYLKKIDSIEINKEGFFINPEPCKEMIISISQKGTDTLQLDRNNHISIIKSPKSNKSGISLQFNNLYYSDTLLPFLKHDTIILNRKKVANYYHFETSLLEKHPEDIKELYMDTVIGFLAFKTVSGEVWTNEKIKK